MQERRESAPPVEEEKDTREFPSIAFANSLPLKEDQIRKHKSWSGEILLRGQTLRAIVTILSDNETEIKVRRSNAWEITEETWKFRQFRNFTDFNIVKYDTNSIIDPDIPVSGYAKTNRYVRFFYKKPNDIKEQKDFRIFVHEIDFSRFGRNFSPENIPEVNYIFHLTEAIKELVAKEGK
jgi:hypothetical protein